MTVKKVEELSNNEKLMLINTRTFINSVTVDKSISDINLILQVSQLNTAIEILMHFIASVKDIGVKTNSGFQKLRAELQKLINNKSLSVFNLSKLEPINNARNNGLHRGIAPQVKYIQDWVQITKEFYDYVSKEIFGKVIELTMISFISQKYWRDKFLEIEGKYNEKLFTEFFNACSDLLRDIESFLITMDIEDIVYNKYVLDIDLLTNYEQSIFRFNTLNFGIKFTEFRKLQMLSYSLSSFSEKYTKDAKVITVGGLVLSLDEYLQEFYFVESIQAGADKLYYKIWDYLVRTGISSIDPFEIGNLVELTFDDTKIETRLISMVLTRPKYKQLYVGYLKDIGFAHNMARKDISFNWAGFGRSTVPVPITKVEYHYLNSGDFTIFILECDKWDYLKQETKDNDSGK